MLGAARRQPGTGGISAFGDHNRPPMRPADSKKRRERPDNAGSALLTKQENEFLFEMLGANRISLAAAVVQLLRASGGLWNHEHVGVVSLVKDYDRKEYALKLYDIYSGLMLWEQPLYKGFRAKSYNHCRKLLSFESDRCIYGLNFSDDQEAANLKLHLEKRYEQEAKTQKPGQPLPQSGPPQPTPNRVPSAAAHPQKVQSPGITDVGSVPHVPISAAAAKKNAKPAKEQKNKKKPKIRKEDIGHPTNFTHKVHVGWDVESGFCQEVHSDTPLDENVKRLLQAAGQDPARMTQEDLVFARKFISNYEPPPGNNTPFSSSSTSSLGSGAGSVNPYAASSTLRRNGGGYAQQPAFQPVSPMSVTPQRGAGYSMMSGAHPPPMAHASPDPPPAPARGTSMAAPAYAQQQSRAPPPSRPPPMDLPRQTAYAEARGVPQYDRRGPAQHGGYSDQSHLPPPPPPMPQSASAQQQNRPGPPPPPPPPPPSANSSGPPPAPPPPPASSAKPAPMAANAPPPPPPPPPAGGAAAVHVKTEPAANDGRSNLLAQIQAGTKLKHVAPPPERSPLGSVVGGAKTGDSRGQMMEQIKQGAQLKHVDHSEADNRKSKSDVQEIGGIAGALARALEERRKNINNTDDSEDSETNDSDWSDD